MKNETEENITKLREIMISKDIESILSDTRFFELFLEAYREKGIPDCEIIKQEGVEMIIRNLGQTIKRIEFEIEHDRK